MRFIHLLLMILILIVEIQSNLITNFYHDGFAVRIKRKFQDGGFSNLIDVFTSNPLKERTCLIHYANSSIYINYNVQFDGQNTGFVFHDALGTLESFVIGDVEGAFPVIQDADFVNSFDMKVSCIIGLGAGNPIFKDSFRITPSVLFDHESNSGNPIQCNLVTNELCSFQVNVNYNGTKIGNDLKIVFTSIYPYTLMPVDIYNAIVLDKAYSLSGEYSDIEFCTTVDETNCFYISKDSIIFHVHEYSTNTIRPYNGTDILIGTSALLNWDIAYSNYTVKINQRAVIISTPFFFQILNVGVSIVLTFLLLTPPIVKFHNPSSTYIFGSIKKLVEGIFLILPMFIFMIEQFYVNMRMETDKYIFFLIAYQGVITFAGLYSFLFNNYYECNYYFFFLIPIISVIDFAFYLSMIDFIEGSPTWGQLALFVIISTKLYTLCLFLWNQEYKTKRPFSRLALIFFWLLVATFFTIWGTTLILVPPLQRIFRIFNAYIVVFYPMFIEFYIIFGCYVYIGYQCMLMKLSVVKIKKS